MRVRIHYTERLKGLMWERWQKGESLQQIAQLFDRNHLVDITDSGGDRGGFVRLPAAAPDGR